jgi:hypothetical protein
MRRIQRQSVLVIGILLTVGADLLFIATRDRDEHYARQIHTPEHHRTLSSVELVALCVKNLSNGMRRDRCHKIKYLYFFRPACIQI